MAITTVDDLLSYVRQQLNSETLGAVDTYSLWKDSELINYIDQAQQEFSRRTISLPDYTTFTINISTGTREYTYSNIILDIQAGYLTTLARRIYARNFNDLERGWKLNSDRAVISGEWEDETGPPKFIITDLHQDKLVLWPIPVADDVLTLYTFKEADHISLTTDNLEIDSQYRLGLTYKVMSLAFNKHDVLETEDLQKSMLFGQKWESFVQDAKATYDKRFKRI